VKYVLAGLMLWLGAIGAFEVGKRVKRGKPPLARWLKVAAPAPAPSSADTTIPTPASSSLQGILDLYELCLDSKLC
jgi:hypothetical protein